jgi:altronate hydrolase
VVFLQTLQVGYASDLVVALAVKFLLAEFPRTLRCLSKTDRLEQQMKQLLKKFIHLMTAYNDAAHKVGQGFT